MRVVSAVALLLFRIPRLAALALAAAAPAGTSLSAQTLPGDTTPLLVPHLTGPIVLDGRVDEAAWEAVPVLFATMHRPSFPGEPTEDTEFRLAHDGEYLYFSCRAYDSDPSEIRTPSLQRDENSFTNDWCMLGLDSYYDRETLQIFATTPAGLRSDVVFANDAESGTNFDWNTFWDVAVSRDDAGWYAEIRVPFTSLRFQEDEGGVTMGVILIRLIARKNEMDTHPPISPQWGILSFFKASQARTAVFQGITAGNPVYVTPYGLAGGSYTYELNDDETAYERETERVTEAGMDLKYRLTENLNLDVTVNTDFAQVEADDRQVNLTRFSLFFPEKRQFFQERRSVFEFSLGGNERLFHSRRIGLAGGEPLRIYGGARVVGRVGDWDVGALSMQTESPEDGGRSENAAALRLRRRVLNENSYVGAIFTSRLGNAGTRNFLYGWDAVLRLFGQSFLTLNWAQSFEPDEGTDTGFFDQSLARVNWQKRGVDGFGYDLDLSHTGDAFEPGLGFLRRRDYSKAGGALGYGWRPGPDAPLLRYSVTGKGSGFWRGEDGALETAEVQLTSEVEWKSGHILTPEITHTVERLTDSFDLSDDAAVPPGDHAFTFGSLTFRQSLGDLFRMNAEARYGGYYDGRLASVSVSPIWGLSRHLELSGTYRVDDVVFDDRDQRFSSHIVRFRAEARLDTRLSGAAFLQYGSVTDALSVNFRIRWNPREGTDLYIVWNEGLATDRRSYDPVRPLSGSRTLVVKYSRTFTLGL